jgi:acyl carrier protein
MAQSDLIAFLRVAQRVIDEYLTEVDGAPSSAASVVSAVGSDNGSAGARQAPGPSPLATNGSRFEEVRAVMMREVIERTGYPEEMLELDLDLEGELGIDTVKQVAVISTVRERFGLDVDPSFKLRDHNTLRKVITHVAGRLERASV